MRLFVKLHLDEDVTVVLADVLRARDFDVTITRDVGLSGATDRQQLEHAVNADRCIITHNRKHFQQLAVIYFEQGLPHHGIIIASQLPLPDLLHGVLDIISDTTADEMDNQIRYV